MEVNEPAYKKLKLNTFHYPKAWELILSQLNDPVDLYRCKITCKLFKNIIENNVVKLNTIIEDKKKEFRNNIIKYSNSESDDFVDTDLNGIPILIASKTTSAIYSAVENHNNELLQNSIKNLFENNP